MGTVTGVDGMKASVVWVEYLSNPTLYQVARGLLFPSPDAPQEHLECVRNCKGKAPPPPKPSSHLDPNTNPLTDLRTNPSTNPKTHPRVTPKHKRSPLVTPHLTQPNNYGTPKRGLRKCNHQVIPPVVLVEYWQWTLMSTRSDWKGISCLVVCL